MSSCCTRAFYYDLFQKLLPRERRKMMTKTSMTRTCTTSRPRERVTPKVKFVSYLNSSTYCSVLFKFLTWFFR